MTPEETSGRTPIAFIFDSPLGIVAALLGLAFVVFALVERFR